jgi:hypothetical protein
VRQLSEPVHRGTTRLPQQPEVYVKIEDAVAAVEARQCTFDEYRDTWVQHRLSSGACDTCDRGLWTLLNIYAIPVGGAT